ncbi:uncharacterized protein METZ01_LOCUS38849 [marine metagenome]|uniref:Uncharacterized protein n=1 Tax=marine metagenome TaxID=408172 RepID=A0A381R2L7_9ZZZZ
MFSKGQLIFAIIFIILFSGVITYTYFKDRQIHRLYYKKTYIILLIFLLFIATIAIYSNLFR